MEKRTIRNRSRGEEGRGKGDRGEGGDRLDLDYVELRDQIVGSPFYQGMQKIMKIRINGWIQIMDTIIVNSIWKKNRNNFAKILNLMCQCQVLVDPFNQPPPKSGLPNISKCQINAVIDHVQLTVKSNSTKLTPQKERQTVRQPMETPRQYWSKVRLVRDQSRQSLQQSSAFLGRFMDIIQNSTETSQVTNEKINAKLSNDSLAADKENKMPCEVQFMKKTKTTQIVHPTTVQTVHPTTAQIVHPKAQAGGTVKAISRHPKIKIREQQTPPSYFPKNVRIRTDFSDIEPPLMIRDQHRSIELTNQTLNTNSLDHQDLDLSEISQNVCTDRTEYNFSEGLTERHLTNDPTVRVQRCFNMAKIPDSEKKGKVRQISLVPSQAVEISVSKMEDLNLSQSSSHVSNRSLTHINRESVIDANSIAESQERQIERRLYWQSNSLSYDFQYKQDEHIQIDQADETERDGSIGEEGSANLLKDSKIVQIN